MATATKIKPLPRKKLADFKWEPNGPDCINCPGGYVISERSARAVNHKLGRDIYDGPRVCVHEGGEIIQICENITKAKQWVVAQMRCIANEYLGLPWGA